MIPILAWLTSTPCETAGLDFAGTVSEVSDPADVRIIRRNDPLPRKAKVKDVLCDGDILRTWFDAWVVVQLAKGGSARLQPDADVVVRTCGITHHSGLLTLIDSDIISCGFSVQLGDTGYKVAYSKSVYSVDRHIDSSCLATTTIAVSDVVNTQANNEPEHQVSVVDQTGDIVRVILGGEAGAFSESSGEVAMLQSSARNDALASARAADLGRTGLRTVPNSLIQPESAERGDKDTRIWIASDSAPKTVTFGTVPRAFETRVVSKQVVGDRDVKVWEIVGALPTGASGTIDVALSDGTHYNATIGANDLWIMLSDGDTIRWPESGHIAQVDLIGQLPEQSPTIPRKPAPSRPKSIRAPKWMTDGLDPGSTAARDAERCAADDWDRCKDLAIAFMIGDRGARVNKETHIKLLELACKHNQADACTLLEASKP